ncbi:MAG TPA: prepilin peptidase [Nitrospirota bacterium]|nr:prepilin peptidase [Nitrospirota bacterium]
MITVVVLLFGLIVGSFLNVCIVRLPRGRSIVSPPSHCPLCKKSLKFYDNIPVISFLILRGRCRSCGEPISWRYPAVELLNGLLYVWTVSEFGIGWETFLVMAFCSALIVITFIDYDHQIIPDVITLPGMLAGLMLAPFVMSALADPLPFHLGGLLPHAGPYLTGFLNSFIGLLFGATPLFAIGWLWEKLRNIEAMGGGDVKLMGMVGSFLGWKGALLTIMLGALAGSVVGITLILLHRHKMDKVIPFGPFLAVGAVMTLFYGYDIISWYLGLIRL